MSDKQAIYLKKPWKLTHKCQVESKLKISSLYLLCICQFPIKPTVETINQICEVSVWSSGWKGEILEGGIWM